MFYLIFYYIPLTSYKSSRNIEDNGTIISEIVLKIANRRTINNDNYSKALLQHDEEAYN